MTAVDYEGRVFRSVANSAGGDVDAGTRFHYRQRGDVVTASYEGGGVRDGVLVALVGDAGGLAMRYAHVADDGRLMTGECTSTLEVLGDGRYRLHESWRWTGGGSGSGTSIVEEVDPERA